MYYLLNLMETEKDIKKYEVGFLGRAEGVKDEIIKLLGKL